MEDKHLLIEEISSFMDEFDPYECMDQGTDTDDIYDIVSEMQFASVQEFLIKTIKE